MDETVLLRLAEDLKRLFVGDVAPAFIGLHHIIGHIAHGDAPIRDIITAAFPHLGAAHPAGTGGCGKLVVLFQPVGNMLDVDGLVLRLDGLLHRDDMHADACASRRNHRGDLLKGQEGHPLKESGKLRMFIDPALVHVEEFRAAGNETGQHIAFFMVWVLAVEILPMVLQQADLAHLLKELLQLFPLYAGKLNELFERLRLAHIHLQGNIRHFIGNDARKAPVFRVLRGDALQFCGHPVGDLPAKLDDLLAGCGVVGDLKGQLALIQRELCFAHSFSPFL